MNDSSSPRPRTLFAKIWDAHAISEEPGQGTLLYIDRHMLNEVTTPQPFASLRAAGRRVHRPEATFGLVDHSIPTTPSAPYGRRSNVPVLDASRATQVAVMGDAPLLMACWCCAPAAAARPTAARRRNSSICAKLRSRPHWGRART